MRIRSGVKSCGGVLAALAVSAVLAAAALVSWIRRSVAQGFAGAALSAAAGDVLILLCGFVWLTIWTHAAVGSAFAMAVLPFLPGEALKVLAAAGIARGLDRMRRNR